MIIPLSRDDLDARCKGKLSDADVRAIRLLYASDPALSCAEIGGRYGVTRERVNQLVTASGDYPRLEAGGPILSADERAARMRARYAGSKAAQLAARRAAREAANDERDAILREMFGAGLSTATMADATGLWINEVGRRLRLMGLRRGKGFVPADSRQRLNDGRRPDPARNEAIRAAYARGDDARDIARAHGLSIPAVRGIVRGIRRRPGPRATAEVAR